MTDQEQEVVTPPSHHLFKTMVVNLKQVRVNPDRARKEFKNIPDLADSIRENGLIQPLVLRPIEGEKTSEGLEVFDLMAGERRYRALLFAGFVEAPVRIYRTDFADDDRAAMIEYEENVSRSDLTWPEEQALLAKIDEARRKIHGSATGQKDGEGWNLDKTAEISGQSPAAVGQKIKFHKDMEARPDVAQKVVGLPQRAAMKEFKRILKAEETEAAVAAGVVEITEEIQLGSCLDLFPKVADDSVDLILTDPPYGLDELAESRPRGEVQAYIDSLRKTDNMDWDGATELLSKLAGPFARVLKPGAHFYMFCKAQLWSFIYDTFHEPGDLELHHTPIIWDKKRTTGPFRGYTYAASYEMIIHGWKPWKGQSEGKSEERKRLAAACRDILYYKTVPQSARIHPFEKPADLLCYLMEQSTHKGDLVLDPFCGSGATVRAARLIQRRSLTFEINEGHYHRALQAIADEQSEVADGD